MIWYVATIAWTGRINVVGYFVIIVLPCVLSHDVICSKLIQMIDKEHIYPKQSVVDASEPYACNNYTPGASYLCNINQLN